MTISKETYDKLVEIKKTIGGTYDDVVSKLIEMDKEYNQLEKIVEYEFITDYNCKVFRVTYGKGEPILEYYNPKGWAKHISAWDNYPKLTKEETKLFISFIVKPNVYIVLQNMGNQLDYDEFTIRKID